MRAEFNFSVPFDRSDSGNLVSEIAVGLFNDDDASIGSIELRYLHAGSCLNRRMSIRDVADADSDVMYDAVTAITTENDELRSDLQLEPGDVVVVERWLIPTTHVVTILDTICFGLSGASVFLVEADMFDAISEAQWIEAGFAKIAGKPWIFRNLSLVSPSERTNPAGKDPENE